MIPAHQQAAIKEASELINTRTIACLRSVLAQEEDVKTEDGHVADLTMFQEKEDDMIRSHNFGNLAASVVLTFETTFEDLDQVTPSRRMEMFTKRAGLLVNMLVADACAAATGRPTITPFPGLRYRIGYRIGAALLHASGRTTFTENVCALADAVEKRMHRECDSELARILAPILDEIPDHSSDPLNDEDARGIPYATYF
ncbi:hypothetical protein MAPG_09291 [Magnaporthiopsis poae ATCC 64411]|uniref:Uncharacterized protein n=1 Tax=Magnaporthiopsis poae (strain ATCC 64411 / 73-15) TaxID=644358 RepID=A0A0C4E9J8_MAGP6|nr:hypothetical protein MAPG_09291 [Magnaporthiopsis poae ATCC 64411]